MSCLSTWMSKNSVVYHDVIFYLLWYNVIRWSSHMRKKSSFLFVKLTKCDKFEWVEKSHYLMTYFLNGPIVNLLLFFAILFYIERKWLLMKNFVAILPLKSKLSGKFQRFNVIAIDRSIKMLKIVEFSKTSIKTKNYKIFYKPQTASPLKEIIQPSPITPPTR